MTSAIREDSVWSRYREKAGPATPSPPTSEQLAEMKASTRKNATSLRRMIDMLGSGEGIHKDDIFGFGGRFSIKQLDRVEEIAAAQACGLVNPPTGVRGGCVSYFLVQSTLDELAQHDNGAIRLGLARSKSVSRQVLDVLVDESRYSADRRDRCDRISAVVAWNPATPGELLAELATRSGQDRRYATQVRLQVARNVNSPTATLDQLAYDVDSEVRAAVVGNPSAPDEARVVATLFGQLP